MITQFWQDMRLAAYALRGQIQRGRLPLMALVVVVIAACSSGSNEESDSDFFGDIADFFDEEFSAIFGDDEDNAQEENVTVVDGNDEGFPDLASVPDVDTLSIEERREALKGGLIPDRGELYSEDTLQADSGPTLGQAFPIQDSPIKESILYPELNPVPSPDPLSLASPASPVSPPAPDGRDNALSSPMTPDARAVRSGVPPLAPPAMPANRLAGVPSVPHAVPPALLPPGTSEDPYRSYYDDGVGRDVQSGSAIMGVDRRRPRFNQGQSQAVLNDNPQISYPFPHQSPPALNTPPVPVARQHLQPRLGYTTGGSVRLGTIYFAHGSAKLTGKDRQILKQIATIQQTSWWGNPHCRPCQSSDEISSRC